MSDVYLVAAAILALTIYLIPNVLGVLRERGKPRRNSKPQSIGEILHGE